MKPINGQRLFFINETDIWAGEDLESCIIGACNQAGQSREQLVHEPCELTDAQATRFLREIGSTLAIKLEEALGLGLSTPVLFSTVIKPPFDVDEPARDRGLLLPPPEGTCPVCATKHEPHLPHNAESLYYQYRFYAQRGRWPTWSDAAAHCSPLVADEWERHLESIGHEWTEPPAGVEPIADPPGESIRQVVEMGGGSHAD